MPAREPATKPDDPAQYKRFLEIAKEVEADESPGAMDKAFDRLKPAIINPPPKAVSTKRRPRNQ